MNHTQTQKADALYFFAIIRCLTDTDVFLTETSTHANMESFA